MNTLNNITTYPESIAEYLRISLAEARTFMNWKTNLQIIKYFWRQEYWYSTQWFAELILYILECWESLSETALRLNRVPVSHDEPRHICRADDIGTFVWKQQFSYLAHIARQSNQRLTKRLILNANTRTKIGWPTKTLGDKVMKYSRLTMDAFYKEALIRKGHSSYTQTNHRQSSNW